MAEEALLGASKADRAADLACAFSVPVSPVMLAARIAASRLLWMMREGAGIGVIDADLLGRELVLDELVFDAFVGQRTAPRRDRAP